MNALRLSLTVYCLLITVNCSLSQGAISAPGDGGPATEATLGWPSGIAIDSDNNIYVAERRGNRVRRIDGDTGIITTLVGTGKAEFGGDGGPAWLASIAHPELIAIDPHDNLIITDRSNARIRRIDTKSGEISTITGNGTRGYSGDGKKAAEAVISNPFGVATDGSGNIFIADTENHVIRRIDHETAIINTVAGNGTAGFSGDGGAATDAQLRRPHNMAVDAEGSILVGDSQNQRIRFVDHKTGRISTLYGTGTQGTSEDGIMAKDADFAFFGSLLLDQAGDLILSGWLDNRIRRIETKTGIITTLAGTGEAGFTGDGGPAIRAKLNGPYGMAMDQQGNLYVAEAENGRVRKISVAGDIMTIAGKGQ